MMEPKASIFDDLGALRLSPEAAGTVGTKEIMTAVPVRKPTRHEFARVNGDPEMAITTMVFDDKDDRQAFLVAPSMWDALAGEGRPATLFTAITRQGVSLIWPLFLPLEGGGGATSGWYESAREAVELAKKKWIRIRADMSLGAYRLFEAQGDLSEPVWPEKTMGELLKIAFKDRVIDSDDHPVVKRLRGLA
jgi:hypothetical protein